MFKLAPGKTLTDNLVRTYSCQLLFHISSNIILIHSTFQLALLRSYLV